MVIGVVAPRRCLYLLVPTTPDFPVLQYNRTLPYYAVVTYL